jgi:hypothetical protein
MVGFRACHGALVTLVVLLNKRWQVSVSVIDSIISVNNADMRCAEYLSKCLRRWPGVHRTKRVTSDAAVHRHLSYEIGRRGGTPAAKKDGSLMKQ